MKYVFSEKTTNENNKKEIFYPLDLETDAVGPLKVKVYSPYVITEDEHGEKHIVAVKLVLSSGNNEEVVSQLRNPGFKSYNPFEENLLGAVPKIDLEDENSILEFCNQFGVLGEVSLRTYGSEMEDNILGGIESLDFFKNEIQDIQELLKLIYAVENKDLLFLEEYAHKNMLENLNLFETIKNNNDMVYQLYKNNFDSLISSLKNIENATYRLDEQIQIAQNSITGMINDKSHLINPILVISKDRKFIPKLTSKTLLGVIYYKIYTNLIDGVPPMKCEFCGDYIFEARKSNARFCPPKVPGVRSDCANRYDAMVRRAREWHFKQGLSPEEIQEKIKKPNRRSLDEINGWIENYKK